MQVLNQTDKSAARESLIQWFVFVLTLALVFSASFFFDPFWIDESVTYWIIKDSFSDVTQRAFNFQGQSPLYYWLLWFWRREFGESEALLRLPSLLFLAGGFTFAFLTARRCFGMSLVAALVTLVVLLSSHRVQLMLSARPYAAGFCFSMLSAFAFMRAFETRKVIWFCTLLLSTTLMLYCHAFFLGFFLVHYLLILILKPEAKLFGLKWAVLMQLVSVALFWPGMEQLRQLGQRTNVLEFDALPPLMDVVISLFPRSIVVALIATLVFVVFVLRGSTLQKGVTSRPLSIALLLWYVLPPLGLYFLCVFFDVSVFKGRYYVWQMTGLAFGYGLFVAAIRPAKSQTIALMVLAASVLFQQGGRQWSDEGWESALEIARDRRVSENIDLVVQPGLVESRDLNWLGDAEKLAYLRSPLSYYERELLPEILPLKVRTDDEKAYVRAKLPPQRFLLLAYRPDSSLLQFLAAEGYARTQEYQPGREVQLFRYERAIAAAD